MAADPLCAILVCEDHIYVPFTKAQNALGSGKNQMCLQLALSVDEVVSVVSVTRDHCSPNNEFPIGAGLHRPRIRRPVGEGWNFVHPTIRPKILLYLG